MSISTIQFVGSFNVKDMCLQGITSMITDAGWNVDSADEKGI